MLSIIDMSTEAKDNTLMELSRKDSHKEWASALVKVGETEVSKGECEGKAARRDKKAESRAGGFRSWRNSLLIWTVTWRKKLQGTRGNA